MRWVELDVGRLLVQFLFFWISGVLRLVPTLLHPPSFVEEILFWSGSPLENYTLLLSVELNC